MDFLSRRPVRAVMLLAFDVNERSAANRLSEGYVLDNGLFRFPAGYSESYFVNGKEYNAEGNRSLDEQKALIAGDMMKEGFSENEVAEFIKGIEIVEGRPMLLTADGSNRWLKYHPEFEKEALGLLGEIRKEVLNEVNTEVGRGGRKSR